MRAFLGRRDNSSRIDNRGYVPPHGYRARRGLLRDVCFELSRLSVASAWPFAHCEVTRLEGWSQLRTTRVLRRILFLPGGIAFAGAAFAVLAGLSTLEFVAVLLLSFGTSALACMLVYLWGYATAPIRLRFDNENVLLAFRNDSVRSIRWAELDSATFHAAGSAVWLSVHGRRITLLTSPDSSAKLKNATATHRPDLLGP